VTTYSLPGRRGWVWISRLAYEPATDTLTLNTAAPAAARGSVRQDKGWRRPPIELEICRVHSSAWNTFKPHHYLSGSLNPSAVCFAAFLEDRPVAFDAWLPFFGRTSDGRPARRHHRSVCLPDFQGVGIGSAVIAHVASLWTSLGNRAFSASSHPALIRGRLRSKLWRMTRAPGFTSAGPPRTPERLERRRQRDGYNPPPCPASSSSFERVTSIADTRSSAELRRPRRRARFHVFT